MRVKLKLRGGRREVEALALVGSGFETDEPQLILPLDVAEGLGLLGGVWDVEEFYVAGGGRALGYRIREPVYVELVLGDREPVGASAVATVMPGEDEVVMSGFLASELGIVLLDIRGGLWCLKDELGEKARESADRLVGACS